MVADIQLLQGKIMDDPDKRTHKIGALIEALAIEFVALQVTSPNSSSTESTLDEAEGLSGGTA